MHTPIQLKTAHFQSEKTEILFQKSIGEKCRLGEDLGPTQIAGENFHLHSPPPNV
jgi:hypothetical protein